MTHDVADERCTQPSSSIELISGAFFLPDVLLLASHGFERSVPVDELQLQQLLALRQESERLHHLVAQQIEAYTKSIDHQIDVLTASRSLLPEVA